MEGKNLKVKVIDDKIDWELPYDKEENKKHYEKLKDIFDLEEFHDNMRRASEEMVRCEIAFRAQKRASLLKKNEKEKYYEKLEEFHHEESIKKLKKALKALKDARRKIKPEVKKEVDEIHKDKKNIEKIKEEYNKAVNDSLIELDLDAEKTEELLAINNESLKYFEEHGFNKSLDKVEANLEELATLRANKEKNRGREHRSPLVWWKWILWGATLILLILSIGGVIATCILKPEACVALIIAGVFITMGLIALMTYIWESGC